tara:strand:- start:545 stop:1702 length:1158 start_codon:yes stop_codon:yes gene_type:complete
MQFTKPVTLFRIFGFQIKADASWLFLSVLIAWSLMTTVFPAAYPGHDPDTYQHMAVWSVVGLLASIIFHELAHAIIAEYYNMPILSIRLFIFGGVAEFKGRPSHARGEFMMAIAGPIMSFLLGLAFWAVYDGINLNFGTGPVAQMFHYLAVLNFLLAGFNLIPAFPLDGGRALRAWLWLRHNNLVIATRKAADLGEIFAFCLMVYGCYRLTIFDDLLGSIWIALMGLFMLGAATYAVRQTESWSILEGQTVRDFMNTDYVHVSPDLNLHDFVEQYVYKYYQQNFPVVDQGRLSGMIDVQAVMSTDRKRWGWTHVGSQMTDIKNLMPVDADTPAAEALDMMNRLNLRTLLVTQKDGLVGIVGINDITNYLSIITKLDRTHITKNSV